MAAVEFAWPLPNSQLSFPFSSNSSQTLLLLQSSSSSTSRRNSLFFSSSSSCSSSSSKNGRSRTSSSIKLQILPGPPFALSQTGQSESSVLKEEENGDDEEEEEGLSNDNGQGNSTIILSSCLVGLLTGIGVVLFNNGVLNCP